MFSRYNICVIANFMSVSSRYVVVKFIIIFLVNSNLVVKLLVISVFVERGLT